MQLSDEKVKRLSTGMTILKLLGFDTNTVEKIVSDLASKGPNPTVKEAISLLSTTSAYETIIKFLDVVEELNTSIQQKDRSETIAFNSYKLLYHYSQMLKTSSEQPFIDPCVEVISSCLSFINERDEFQSSFNLHYFMTTFLKFVNLPLPQKVTPYPFTRSAPTQRIPPKFHFASPPPAKLSRTGRETVKLKTERKESFAEINFPVIDTLKQAKNALSDSREKLGLDKITETNVFDECTVFDIICAIPQVCKAGTEWCEVFYQICCHSKNGRVNTQYFADLVKNGFQILCTSEMIKARIELSSLSKVPSSLLAVSSKIKTYFAQLSMQDEPKVKKYFEILDINLMTCNFFQDFQIAIELQQITQMIPHPQAEVPALPPQAPVIPPPPPSPDRDVEEEFLESRPPEDNDSDLQLFEQTRETIEALYLEKLDYANPEVAKPNLNVHRSETAKPRKLTSVGSPKMDWEELDVGGEYLTGYTTKLQAPQSNFMDHIDPAKLTEYYKNTPKQKILKGGSVFEVPEIELKEHPKDKWVYQLLVEAKPVTRMVDQIVKKLRSYYENLWKKTSDLHTFYWVIMVDNSGSMGCVRNQSAESLVVAIEVLRKLECKFAVVRFGGKTNQFILKKFEDTFNNYVGERILESFSYNEGTYPGSAIESVAKNLWKTQEKAPNEHRMMVMITDGLTKEETGWETVQQAQINFGLLLLTYNKKEFSQNNEQFLKQVTSGGNCYIMVDGTDADNVNGIGVLLSLQYEHQLKGIAVQDVSKREPTVVIPKIGSFMKLVNIDGENMYANYDVNVSTGPRPSTWFETSQPLQPIPHLELLKKSNSNDTLNHSLKKQHIEDSLQGLKKLHDELIAKESDGDLSKAESHWKAITIKLKPFIGELIGVFEEYLFPVNRYTRYKAHYQGDSLHLGGLIRAVATDFNYKKFFKIKEAGSKREHTVSLLIDVSISMDNHLTACAIESLICFICALQELEIESFSIITFGERVTIVKSEDIPFDSATIYTLLAHLQMDKQNATLDADAIDVALDLMEMSTVRGNKTIFVFTDGYGTCGLRLTKALERADRESVKVIGVGTGFGKTFVSQSYQYYVNVLYPSAMPHALRALYEPENTPVVNHDENSHFLPLLEGAEDTQSILNKRTFQFPGFAEQLQGLRELNIKPGNSNIEVDVCLCIDSTGSMARFWPYVLHNVEEISTRLVNFKVAHKFQNLNMKVRYAIILYKDFGDPAEVMNFCEISDPSKLLQRLQSIQPTGGDDVPEDLFGALESVLDLGWNHHNNSVKFLILFTDAPAHGKNYNSCPDDKFPDKKAPLEVFKKFNEMKLEFLFCTFDNVQTKETIISFSSPNHYANMKTVLLTRTPPRPQHFIFVLDQSSSMKGERWEYLKRAYKSFILQRQKDQGLKDRVTVITFTTTPIVVREYIPLSSALDIPLEQPSASWSPFGGTKFDPAINRIEPIIAKTIDTHLPVMIFMSDGGDKSSTSPNILTGYKKSYPTFVYHIIGFGLDTTTEKGRRNTAMLEEMGKEGKYFPSPTNESLLLVFQDIAKENQAFSTSIIEGVIYKSLEDKIVTDYL